QTRMGRLVESSIDRLGPVRRAREEMNVLRDRLEQLEASLAELETAPAPTESRGRTEGSQPAPTRRKKSAAG
ncbi:MAG TPA: hypothetical protein VMR44_03040, partial [Thermoanaerobaculia bacterium]|nr:hypothetical protein [Thermoanaerobaculia bacterium]